MSHSSKVHSDDSSHRAKKPQKQRSKNMRPSAAIYVPRAKRREAENRKNIPESHDESLTWSDEQKLYDSGEISELCNTTSPDGTEYKTSHKGNDPQSLSMDQPCNSQICDEMQMIKPVENIINENTISDSTKECFEANECIRREVLEQDCIKLDQRQESSTSGVECCSEIVANSCNNDSPVVTENLQPVVSSSESNVNSGNVESDHSVIGFSLSDGDKCRLTEEDTTVTGLPKNTLEQVANNSMEDTREDNQGQMAQTFGNKEPDETGDTWDSLFDDSGEALEPGLLDELTAAVGKVKVEKTQFDYYNYQAKEVSLDDIEDCSHLIEIYDFPKELQTRDLVVAFSEFKDKGFDIKWVDDTHAIGVFSSSIAARSALTLVHPLMKVRRISEASRQTKLKTKKSTELWQPYKPRPETVASVARNMVAGALGLQTNVPKEKREEERRKLKQAKEQKRAMKKQKQAAWDGQYGGKCAMDEY